MSEIQVFDFSTNKFDGDQRQAHQFIPYVYEKIQAKGIDWILNLEDYPQPQTNLMMKQAALNDERYQNECFRKYKGEMKIFTHNKQLWDSIEQNILDNPDHIGEDEVTRQRLRDALDEIEDDRPIRPHFRMPDKRDLHMSSESQNRFERSADKRLKYTSVAAEALQMVLKYISPNLKMAANNILNKQGMDGRMKLLSIWTWLQTYRVDNYSIISDVQQDMQSLSTIDTFSEALLRINDMNILQYELATMNAPYTDRELIVIHAGKLRGDRFKEINYKWLQRSSKATSSQPSENFLTNPAIIQQSFGPQQTIWNWLAYCEDMMMYNNTDNSARTTSTVNKVQGHKSSGVKTDSNDEEMEEKVMAFFTKRYGNHQPSYQGRSNAQGRSYDNDSRTYKWRRGNPNASQSDYHEKKSYEESQHQYPHASHYKQNRGKYDQGRGRHDQNRGRYSRGQGRYTSKGRGYNSGSESRQSQQSKDTQSKDPLKRAYRAYVEEYTSAQNTQSEPFLCYDDFLCENAHSYVVFGASKANKEESGEKIGEEEHYPSGTNSEDQ